MKKKFLLFLAIANVATAFGVTIEKDGIVVEYKQCDKYNKIIKFNRDPYCIAIQNDSDRPVIVNESIISAPLYSYEAVLQVINRLYKSKLLYALVYSLMSAHTGFRLRSFYNDEKNREIRRQEGMNKVAALLKEGVPGRVTIPRRQSKLPYYVLGGVLGGLGIYEAIQAALDAWKAAQLRAMKHNLFHTDITIQPGQSVEKIFWLKDPNAQFEIDFDTIKVLK